MRSVCVLGATGSIGAQALEIVAGNPDLRCCGLAAHSDVDGLLRAAQACGAELVALADPAAAEQARGRFPGRVLAGPEGVVELVRSCAADVVLNGVVGRRAWRRRWPPRGGLGRGAGQQGVAGGRR